mmetsp:Transcript_29535/g.66853  ORF Transcript_29535/g.66853 Transcript_29535/m.66853 type:complete len:505 (+) Transcript_29535:278-1792(+)
MQPERLEAMLKAFGPLKAYQFFKDDNGAQPSAAMFEFFTLTAQRAAIMSLEGIQLGNGKSPEVMDPEKAIREKKVPSETLMKGSMNTRIVPCRVIMLKNIVAAADLDTEEDYQSILEDIRLECEPFGEVTGLHIPRMPVAPSAPSNAIADATRSDDEDQPKAATLGLPTEYEVEIEEEEEVTDNEGEPEVTQEEEEAKQAEIDRLKAQDADEATLSDLEQEEEVTKPKVKKTKKEMVKKMVTRKYGLGLGYAFIRFETIAAAAKCRKSLGSRKFGGRTVEASYFSETKFRLHEFEEPVPNSEFPPPDPVEYREPPLVMSSDPLLPPALTNGPMDLQPPMGMGPPQGQLDMGMSHAAMQPMPPRPMSQPAPLAPGAALYARPMQQPGPPMGNPGYNGFGPPPGMGGPPMSGPPMGGPPMNSWGPGPPMGGNMVPPPMPPPMQNMGGPPMGGPPMGPPMGMTGPMGMNSAPALLPPPPPGLNQPMLNNGHLLPPAPPMMGGPPMGW